MKGFPRERPYFKDREEAARLLIEKLSDYVGTNPLVLAIPRGSVGMGRMIADALKGELDLVLVHKIGLPGDPELAIGAVSENGAYFTTSYFSSLNVPGEWIQKEVECQTKRLQEQRRLFTPARAAVGTRGRVVIIVDDCIATGSTVLAAVQGVAQGSPKKIVVATPVAPPDTVGSVRREVDKVVVISTPEDFHSVGEFYEKFPQVSDQEVVKILNRHPVSS